MNGAANLGTTHNHYHGIGIAPLLCLLFLGLKLAGAINWSWWWIFAPLWGMLAIAVLILVIGAMITGIQSIIHARTEEAMERDLRDQARRRENLKTAIEDGRTVEGEVVYDPHNYQPYGNGEPWYRPYREY